MHTDFLKSISATTVLDRNSSSEYLAAEMKKITNLPIRFLFDTISIDSTQKTGLDLLVPGGQMVIVLPPLVKADKKVIFHAFASISLPYNMEPICGPLYHEKPSRLVERGIIKPNRVVLLPNGLQGIPEALKRLESDSISRLKLVAHPQEAA